MNALVPLLCAEVGGGIACKGLASKSAAASARGAADNDNAVSVSPIENIENPIFFPLQMRAS